MKWSQNNRACKTVWTTLMVLDQINEQETFAATGAIKVGDLTFYPKDGTQDVLAARAKALALQIDKVFRKIRGAVYEEGKDQMQAVTAMTEVLKDKDKTVAEFAGIADDLYRFFQEGEDV